MTQTTELMAAGIPALVARLIGTDPLATISAAGTTQATATLVVADASNVTTVAANAGVRLPSAGSGQGETIILNSGANVLSIYPATGEKINGQAANSSIVVAPTKSVFLWSMGNQWIANISA